MDTDPTSQSRSAAIEQLRELGLSAYAARTYVALAGLDEATANEVSQVSDVPRTRVYDAIDELHDRGLVDIQHSTPKVFWAVSSETASRTFEHEYTRRTQTLRTALSELEPIEQQAEQRGVWTVEGQPAVTQRVLEFLNEAEEEIVYMSVEDLLTEELLEGLRAASDRGVSIKFGGVSADVHTRIQDAIPDATTFDSLWAWEDTPAGRLMMVDGRATLVSALLNGAEATPSDPRSETAIWGEGEANSLVAVLKAMFTWQLEGADPE